MVLPKSAIENSGIAYYFKDKIPQGSEIKLANEVKKSKVYNVYYLGFPVQGCQIVTVQFGQKVAINATVNSNILFEKIAAENKHIQAEWLFMETQNTYGLFGYSGITVVFLLSFCLCLSAAEEDEDEEDEDEEDDD